jgi:hypothetical protein
MRGFITVTLREGPHSLSETPFITPGLRLQVPHIVGYYPVLAKGGKVLCTTVLLSGYSRNVVETVEELDRLIKDHIPL